MENPKKYGIIAAFLAVFTGLIGGVATSLGKSFIDNPLESTKTAIELIFGVSSLPAVAQKLFGSETSQPSETVTGKQIEEKNPLIGHGPNGPYLRPEGVRIDNSYSTIPESYARHKYSGENVR